MQLKKIFVSLLVVIMILSTAVIGAMAADNEVFEYSVAVIATEAKDGSTVAVPGDTVKVEVTITNNPGAAYVQFTVNYDPEILELVTDENGDVRYESEDGNVYTYSVVNARTPGEVKFVSLLDPDALSKKDTGYLAVLEFKVIASAEGDTEISLTKPLAFASRFDGGAKLDVTANTDVVTIHNYVEDTTKYMACTGYRYFVCECGAYYELEPNPDGHNIVTDEAVDATCTEDGATKKIYCNNEGCTYVELASEVIPATGHTEEILKAVDATCVASGLTEGVKCSVCDAILVKQAVIPSAAHVAGEWIVDLEPKCNATGSKHKNCVNCDQLIEVQVIPVLPHNNDVVLPAQAATCTTNGLTEGSKCSMCAFVMVEQQVIPATGHTEVVIPAVEPTYSEDGSTEGKQCSTCGAITDAPGVVPAKSLAWLWVLIGAVIVIGAGVAVYFFVLRKKK